MRVVNRLRLAVSRYLARQVTYSSLLRRAAGLT